MGMGRSMIMGLLFKLGLACLPDGVVRIMTANEI